MLYCHVKGKKKNKERTGDRELGENLRKLILVTYPSQKDFSLAAECSEEYVSRVINAAISPSHKRLKDFARALNVPLRDLVDPENSNDKTSNR